MSNTGLNVGAIVVFGITLLVLLGPWLHLSPSIPVALTTLLLSLLALDTWGLQNQGSAIVFEWLAAARGDQVYAQRVLHHEAGHFLLAYLFNIPVQGYSLSAWESFRQGLPGQGGVRFETAAMMEQWRSGQVAAQDVDKYSVLWMAGVAAEMLTYGNAIGGQDDRAKLRSLGRQVGRSAVEIAQQERWAILRAKTLLQNNSLAYDALVVAMQTRQPVEQCWAQLQQLTVTST